jgi:predicted ArsR family transcriptional regulator
VKDGISERGPSGGSRERIVRLLLRDRMTIDKLALELGVTKNAVRAQIALLERGGMVEVQGERKGTRRPAAVYGLRAGADTHFSQAYPALLTGVVSALADRLKSRQFEDVLRETGKRIADAALPLAGNARERVDGAVRFLGTLGSIAEVIEEEGKLVIKGHGCPISKVVQADGRSCLAMESLLARLTGLKVRERCDHGARPGCRFVVELPARPRHGSRAKRQQQTRR